MQQTKTIQESPLRAWRRGVGMTQEQLAELIGVTQGNISQVENALIPIDGKLKKYLEGIADLEKKQREFMQNTRVQSDREDGD